MSYLKNKISSPRFEQFLSLQTIDEIVLNGIKNKIDTDKVNITWTNTLLWYKIIRLKLIDLNRRLKFPSIAISRKDLQVDWKRPNQFYNTGLKYVLLKKIVSAPQKRLNGSVYKPAVWLVKQCDPPLFMLILYLINIVANMQQDFNDIIQDILSIFLGGRCYLFKLLDVYNRRRRLMNRYGVHIVILNQNSLVLNNKNTGNRIFQKKISLKSQRFLYRNILIYTTRTKNNITFINLPNNQTIATLQTNGSVVNVSLSSGAIYNSISNNYVDSSTAINNYSSTSIVNNYGSSGNALGGAIFITDIRPSSTGTVSSKVLIDGIVLQSCVSDTDLLTVYVLAKTGYSSYKPIVYINGVSASNLIVNTRGDWTGSVNITSTGTNIYAQHIDGATGKSIVTRAVAPQITNILFGSYPGAQTALKSNDIISATINTDMLCNYYLIYNFESSIRSTGVLSGSSPYNISTTIANRGTGIFNNQSLRLRVRTSSGIYSLPKQSSLFGSTVILDNDLPTISSIVITYPTSQSALKNSLSATAVRTVSPSTGINILYSSPLNLLSISNSATYNSTKVVSRVGGNYNISSNNYRIAVTKLSNNTSRTSNAIINIANIAMTLTVSLASRLRSGGNYGTSAQNHTITITGNQNLLIAPTLGATAGTWQGSGFVGSNTTWTRSLQIHDNDSKGTKYWSSISAVNLAGISTTAISTGPSYVIGGFVFRTLSVSAWPNRLTRIGTSVVDTSKLRCSNLAKGRTGSLNFTFQSTTANVVDRYTITQPSGVYNATGNLWFNCLLANRINNTLGIDQIELLELI